MSSYISIRRTPTELSINTPFNRDFVYQLKRDIPAGDRAWVKPDWVVTRRHEQNIIKIIRDVFNEDPHIIDDTAQASTPIIRMIKLEYLGRCKDKFPDEPMASGWVDGNWSVAFRESALRSFFEGTDTTPQAQSTTPRDDSYYGTLGIPMFSPAEDIKKAYRRMARQWHPDVNKGDPDADEMFKKINTANSVLSDPPKKKKYDFILRITVDQLKADSFLEQLKKSASSYSGYDDVYGYRAPYKCGLLLVEGTITLGRLVVSKIHSWDDIIENGKMMVSSWPAGADKFVIQWI